VHLLPLFSKGAGQFWAKTVMAKRARTKMVSHEKFMLLGGCKVIYKPSSSPPASSVLVLIRARLAPTLVDLPMAST